ALQPLRPLASVLRRAASAPDDTAPELRELRLQAPCPIPLPTSAAPGLEKWPSNSFLSLHHSSRRSRIAPFAGVDAHVQALHGSRFATATWKTALGRQTD